MQLKTLLLVGFMAISAAANVADTEHSTSICGASTPAEDHLNIPHARSQQETPSNIGKRAVIINVVVHVVAASNSPGGGNVPDGQIHAQINVLNQAYSRYGFNFRITGIDRRINPVWSRDANEAQEREMKTYLRKGNAATLNIYILTGIAGAPPGQTITGKTPYPWEYPARPWADGSSLLYTTLPGGSQPGNDRGITAVHEVGHWLGLYHTFQGGCSAPGDYVDDTPFQHSASIGCPTGRNTCPQAGLDPIHNYMDFSNDGCRTEFTPGQVIRMTQAARQFRGI